ncbi:MAG: hypothetical protein CM15mP115_09300 [Alphaproteobacteria bacterium]|nr:MAG: hypothetical protein CM15mP115_09300 [Alphaproteobacteria bacterium]
MPPRRRSPASRAVPAIQEERQAYAAGDEEPPAGGAWQGKGLQGPEHPAGSAGRGSCPDQKLIDAAKAAWDKAVELGSEHGYRNAQATVIAPTGTIGLVMDCDTTGIEPDFAIVKFKKLAGGGYFKIINRVVPKRSPTSATARRRFRTSSTMPSARQPEELPVDLAERASRQGLRRRGTRQGRSGHGKRLRREVRLQPLHSRR